MGEMSAWMQQGFKGLNDMSALFQRSYGLKGPESGGGPDSPEWQKAIADFQQALAQSAGPWGWVSQTEHQKTLEKCSALEKKVQEQQETVERLRELLAQEGRGHAELFKHLQDSLKEQGDQFHELMQGISGSVKEDS